jgi:hypothetical protein
LLLGIQAFCFFLLEPSDQREASGESPSYIIDWAEIYAVVDRIFLILTALDKDGIQISAVQLYCL